ncbi:hypothetical protein ACFC0M_36665, partial [Streptomyces sp. NPDC056149]
MSRVAEAANSLAIAVAATAVGCTLVLELAPAHHPSMARGRTRAGVSIGVKPAAVACAMAALTSA